MREFSPSMMLLPLQYTTRQVQLDMRVLLWRGGAGAKTSHVSSLIAEGRLGKAEEKRFPLVSACHEYFLGEIAEGTSDQTIRSHHYAIRIFYRFVDERGGDLDASNVRMWFKAWVDVLLQRVSRRELKADIAYHQGKSAASVLSRALDVPFISIAKGTRLKKPKKSKKVLGAEADKQNLSETQAFGVDLLDVADSLSFENCIGPLPVMVKLRSTQCSYEFWCGIQPAHLVKAEVEAETQLVGSPKVIRENRAKRSLHPVVADRFRVVNLRVCAEFLIFIAQTGMNRAQAMAVTFGDFRYESWQDGYRVRKYKGRKKGEVEFEIFSEYRPHFERYLLSRKAAFEDGYSNLLFPVFSRKNIPRGAVFNIENMRRFLGSIGRPFLSPQKLRGTRVNWLIRAADDDLLVAQMAQHDVATLHRSYAKPNHQRAAVEWTEYYQGLESALIPAPAPGACETRTPQRADHFEAGTPEPDCRNPAGCLFCVFYRGIESLDYAWSMHSYRVLKRLELSRYQRLGSDELTNAPLMVIERVTDVIREFQGKSECHGEWVQEASARCEEENYHPRWAGFIWMAEAIG